MCVCVSQTHIFDSHFSPHCYMLISCDCLVVAGFDKVLSLQRHFQCRQHMEQGHWGGGTRWKNVCLCVTVWTHVLARLSHFLACKNCIFSSGHTDLAKPCCVAFPRGCLGSEGDGYYGQGLAGQGQGRIWKESSVRSSVTLDVGVCKQLRHSGSSGFR